MTIEFTTQHVKMRIAEEKLSKIKTVTDAKTVVRTMIHIHQPT